MIGFRVDANETIATGHMMRCIAIATQCRRQGMDCLFILAEDKETEKLSDYGFSYSILNSKWDDMETEKDKMVHLLKEKQIDWLVVDSYQVTASYLQFLNNLVPVMYIDDMMKEVYSVTALLHYSQWSEDNFYQKRYAAKEIKLLAGMQFVPLREEFLPKEQKEKREDSILITTGGTDTYNVSCKVLQSLRKEEKFRNYDFHVIVGSLNQNKKMIMQMQQVDKRIILHENVKNMGSLMRKCRYAVSAGGTTLYELCACGIPTVCFSFADNQQSFTYEMGNHKIMYYAGDARNDDNIGIDIVHKLCSLLEQPEETKNFVYRMQKLVDGKGTQRIAEFLKLNVKEEKQINEKNDTIRKTDN